MCPSRTGSPWSRARRPRPSADPLHQQPVFSPRQRPPRHKAGQLPEALEQIRRAVRTGDVIDPAIWEHYGDIALSMNLKDEARNAYLKALEHKPANADALRQRLSTL